MRNRKSRPEYGSPEYHAEQRVRRYNSDPSWQNRYVRTMDPAWRFVKRAAIVLGITAGVITLIGIFIFAVVEDNKRLKLWETECRSMGGRVQTERETEYVYGPVMDPATGKTSNQWHPVTKTERECINEDGEEISEY